MADILVIEDDKAIRNLLKIALKQENHTVAAVRTAREGIDYVVKNIVDLIVLDLGLPDMDGINVVETVRGFSENLPIIVVSARDDENEKIKCLDAGINDYVQKPFFDRGTDGAHSRRPAPQRGGRGNAGEYLYQRKTDDRLCRAQRISGRCGSTSDQL